MEFIGSGITKGFIIGKVVEVLQQDKIVVIQPIKRKHGNSVVNIFASVGQIKDGQLVERGRND